MDFLACLTRQGVAPDEVRAQLDQADSRARQLGLARLQDHGQSIPVWVRDPRAWHVQTDAQDRSIAVADTRKERLRGNLESICRAPKTGPAIECAWDAPGGTVASDQVGIGTTYWRETSAAVLAASRSSYLIEPGDARLNLEAAFHFLNFSAVPTPLSIFEGVWRLAPGKMLVVGDRVEEVRFWDLEYGQGAGDDGASALRGRIRSAVATATADLDPDVTGAFLSGGTDSTTVAGFASEMFGKPLDVFSIVFDEQAYSEEPFIRAAATRFPLRIHSLTLDENAFMAALGPVRRAYDEPYANPSAHAAYHCCRLAHEAGKTYLLAGDGGDEIFGGNERYLKDRLLGLYGSIPALVRSCWEMPIERWPLRSHLVNRLTKIARRARLSNPDRFYADMEFASAHWTALPGRRFLEQPIPADASLSLIRRIYDDCPAKDELHKLLYLDMKLAIADNDLLKVVGCSAIFGIEPRFPLLDLELVQFVNGLPAFAKLRRTQKRYLFKKAMKGYLPDQILFKRKQGMGIPLDKWLRQSGPVATYARERFEDSSADALFDRRYLRTIWDRHQRGEWDYGEDLWRMVVLIDWCACHTRGGR